ncbi:acyl-CoA dehydrogenase family protein [Jatrophihabitans endophyticus]|uniref:acyl-CoA dehydrogenase family protein n=1 Tax=Jatrophihabitans endophyticus TaxID=1206085 RepID=UPI001A035741|nr:acyl-CoA dehydrogenase family protein [Jatrophihabitans endophyticus]MBE7188631.1 acyl-CoA dehydrogenase family protein [Jatrophihabitans endophyticus]
MSGRNTRGRDQMGVALAGLNKLAGLPVIDRLGLRKQLEKLVYVGAKQGFRTVGVANRTFAGVAQRGKPERPRTGSGSGLFDLEPDDEQKMIVEATREFALEQLRPAAAAADDELAAPDTVLKRSVSELGVTLVGIPEPLGGMGSERSATTSALVAEALAYGDMGLAVACLAPAAVSTALVLWGDEAQQATYLPSFVGDDVPAAALAVLEPHPLFDPFALRTTATRRGDDLVLSGVKSLVPRAAEAELFVVAADLDGSPVLVVLESGTSGVSIEAEPAMGLRAAATGRLILDDVTVPSTAVLGGGHRDVYAECVRLSRIGWAALACGTGRAVLDYVIPYVNERKAFGEPISNRQAVAFKVADIGIELEGARLTTLRAASRADQGLEFAREAALARRLTAEYGMQIGTDGVQLLGGHGFVKEHPVERWYRDLRAAAVMEGVVLV